MYVIISIIKIQPVTVVEAWEIISLFVCAQTNTSVLSSCLQQKFKVWELFVWAGEMFCYVEFCRFPLDPLEYLCWCFCTRKSRSWLLFLFLGSKLGPGSTLFCQVSTTCVSKVRPHCSEVWISELWRFMARTLVYSSRYFQWKQVIRHNNEPWRDS